jgi:F-type H+-transporting ATPase subunit gamma
MPAFDEETFGPVAYMPVDVAGGQYDPQIETDASGNVYAAWINGERAVLLIIRRQPGANILDTIEMGHVKRLSFADAAEIGRRVLELYAEGQFDVATICYAKFKSVMSQEPVAQRLIPAPIETANGSKHAAGAVYDYEPDEAEILANLLPRNVSVQIFRALLENAASEQGARMTAMDSATTNASKMMGSLTLQMNRARQASITRELMEIVGTAEALK